MESTQQSAGGSRRKLALAMATCLLGCRGAMAWLPTRTLSSGQLRGRGRGEVMAGPSVPRQRWWADPAAARAALDGSAPGGRLMPRAVEKRDAVGGLKRLLLSVALPIIAGAGPVGGYFNPEPAAAADTVRVAGCLLKNCQLELARCILDPKCLANVVCINTCNDRPDETECQIGCGNLFENEVVGEFNACALSKKQCVPQKKDDGSYPVPPTEALVQAFKLDDFKGRWYISAGLNPLFDTFDCQVHFFNIQGDKLYAKLNWRITEPDGEFFTRNTIQRFVQDRKNPGILYNHDNEYLHYQDDWYIMDHEPNEYIAVYYRGRNDAWVGYGGAVLYTRSPTVPNQYRQRITEAFARAGVDFNKFIETDNTCKDLSTSPTVLRAEFAKKLFLMEENSLQESLTAARNTASNAVMMKEKEAQKAFEEIEKAIVDAEKAVGKETAGALKTVEEEIVKDVVKLEKALEKDVKLVEKEVEEVEKVIEADVWKLQNKKSLDDLLNKLDAKPLVMPATR